MLTDRERRIIGEVADILHGEAITIRVYLPSEYPTPLADVIIALKNAEAKLEAILTAQPERRIL